LSLTSWYVEMTPSWLCIEPRTRRRLVLRTHRWIVERVLADGVSPSSLLGDLGPDGRLRTALAALVPSEQGDMWWPWIRLVLHDFRRALMTAPSPVTEAWCRWLFLIPYSLPLRTRGRAGKALPGRSARRQVRSSDGTVSM
jgi:hypothetical protein